MNLRSTEEGLLRRRARTKWEYIADAFAVNDGLASYFPINFIAIPVSASVAVAITVSASGAQNGETASR